MKLRYQTIRLPLLNEGDNKTHLLPFAEGRLRNLTLLISRFDDFFSLNIEIKRVYL